MMRRSVAKLNNLLSCQFSVLRRKTAPLKELKQQIVADSGKLSDVHTTLRTSTSTQQFLELLRSEQSSIRKSGMLVALESFSQSLAAWAPDDTILQIVRIFELSKLSPHELVLKLRVLGQIKEKLFGLDEKKWVPVRQEINNSIKRTIDRLNECCSNKEFNMQEVLNYIDALSKTDRYPIQPLQQIDKCLEMGEKIVGRSLTRFTKFYRQCPPRIRTQFHHIERFLLYEVNALLLELPIHLQVELFLNISMHRMHLFGREQRLPTCIETMAQIFIKDIDKLDIHSIYFLADSFNYLPQSFGNELLEKCVMHAEHLLGDYYEAKVLRFLEMAPLKRLKPHIANGIVDKVIGRLSDKQTFIETVVTAFRNPFIMSRKKQVLIRIVKDQIKQLCKDGEALQRNGRHRNSLLQALYMLSRENEWVQQVDSILPELVKLQQKTMTISSKNRLILALVQEKKRSGSNQYDSLITSLIENHIQKLETCGAMKAVEMLKTNFLFEDPMLQRFHEFLLYKFLKHTNIFAESSPKGAEMIVELSRYPGFEKVRSTLLECCSKYAANGIVSLLDSYSSLVEKTRDQTKFLMAIMQSHHAKLNKYQFEVLVMLVSTPASCLVDYRGVVDKNLEYFLNKFTFSKDKIVSPAALINCLRLLRSIDAPADQLTSVFMEIVSDADAVGKLQIKQLLTALELVLSNQDKSHQNYTAVLKVCFERLKMFLEMPNIGIKMRAECLNKYIAVGAILDKKNQSLVDAVSKEILSRNATLSEKEMAFPMWLMLCLEARGEVKIHALEKETLLLRIKQLSHHDTLQALLQLLPEFKQTYYGEREFSMIKSQLLPLAQNALQSTSTSYPVRRLIELYEFGLIYQSKPIQQYVQQALASSKLTSTDSFNFCMLLSKKRDTSKQILDRIVADIMQHSHSYQFSHKFQIVFMFAKNFYELPQQYLECVQLMIRQIEQETKRRQKETEQNPGVLLGKLFGRYHLNYLWSLLVLQIDAKETQGFKQCISLFQDFALQNCKNSANRYLIGMTADIFLMLYKEPGVLSGPFVEKMLKLKHLWSRKNESQGNFPAKSVPDKSLEAIEKYERDGFVVDYYIPKTNTVVIALNSYYLSTTHQETGFSKMRDTIIKRLFDNPTIIKATHRSSSQRTQH